MRSRFYIGIVFLGLQCISIIAARFIPERFFCWAPFDEHTLLHTEIEIDNNELSREETDTRYRYLMNTWEPRAVHNVFNIVEQYETTYGKTDSARVIIKYSTNGHPEQTWQFPISEP